MALLIPILGVSLRNKAKADKSDIMGDVESKIAEELKPIIKEMEEYERDLKELRKDELEPIKQDVNDIKRDMDVMNNMLITLVKTLERNHEESNKNHSEIKEILKDRDKSYKENFLLLFNKLDTKQDKK